MQGVRTKRMVIRMKDVANARNEDVSARKAAQTHETRT